MNQGGRAAAAQAAPPRPMGAESGLAGGRGSAAAFDSCEIGERLAHRWISGGRVLLASPPSAAEGWNTAPGSPRASPGQSRTSRDGTALHGGESAEQRVFCCRS